MMYPDDLTPEQAQIEAEHRAEAELADNLTGYDPAEPWTDDPWETP